LSVTKTAAKLLGAGAGNGLRPSEKPAGIKHIDAQAVSDISGRVLNLN